MSDEVANRLNEVIKRFQTIREPLRRNRKLRRKAFLDTILDGLKARSEKRNPKSSENEESLEEENERLKAQLKKEKEEEENSHSFAGRGVRRTKDGREIAIEL